MTAVMTMRAKRPKIPAAAMTATTLVERPPIRVVIMIDLWWLK